MDIARVKYVINEHLCDGITKDTMLLWLDNLNDRAKIGDKHVSMWENLKSTYGYRTTYDALGQQCLGKLADIMDKIKNIYFPKPKTKMERITDIIEAVYNLNVHPRADTVDVIDMLLKLRDEEEDE